MIGSEPGSFRRGLLGLVALGCLSQAFIQSQAFSVNPMVLVPQVDAMVIWEHAGKIAAGEVVGDRPFDTAPLILWLAGALRALGGGLVAWGVLQSVLYVATAVLIALGTRAFSGQLRSGGVGLVAGGLFLLLDEPAAATSRVLSGSLQLFLGAALLLAVAPRRDASGEALPLSAKRGAIAGVLLGLLCLAYPPIMLGVPLFGLWAFFQTGRRWRSAALLMGTAVLAILPATVHNALAVGEFIPISSQAGLTFYHGNNSSADGMIAPVGVVNDKGAQAVDSLTQARAAIGESAGWKDASSYWMDKGLGWWRENPGDGVRLALVKLWFGLSGQRYGDVYQPWRERDAGVASRLWIAPLPLAWLVPVSLVMLFLGLRDKGTRLSWVPLLIIVAVPLAVVVAFFYTPRYRLVAAVAFVPLAAMALSALLTKSQTALDRRRTVLLGLAMAMGAASGTVNRWLGLDLDPTGAQELRFLEASAAGYGKLDRHGEGARNLYKVLQLDPENAENRGRLLDLCWYLAASSTAEERDPAVALEITEQLVAEFGPAPGLLDLRGVSKAALGDFKGAQEDATMALQGLAPGDPVRIEVEQRQALFATGQSFELSSSNL